MLKELGFRSNVPYRVENNLFTGLMSAKVYFCMYSPTRKGTQCPSFHYSGTQYPPKYRVSTKVQNTHQSTEYPPKDRIPTPQLNKIKLGLPRLPREEKRRVAGDYGAKSSSPSNRIASNQ